MFQALALETWEEVNTYFEDDWEYVDCHIVEKQKKIIYLFVLEKRSPRDRILRVEKVN